MAEQFYTILTNTGKAKIANSLPTGTKVNLTKLKIGDSNGAYYNPSESQTDIIHKVYECNITSVEVDEDNPNWITIISVIPSDVGGFMIREVGAFDADNNLIAIGKYPETYKPVAADGSTKELYIKMTLEITNASSVEFKIDPTVIIATKSDINILTNSIAQINTQLSDVMQETIYLNGSFNYKNGQQIGSNFSVGSTNYTVTELEITNGIDILASCKPRNIAFCYHVYVDGTTLKIAQIDKTEIGHSESKVDYAINYLQEKGFTIDLIKIHTEFTKINTETITDIWNQYKTIISRIANKHTNISDFAIMNERSEITNVSTFYSDIKSVIDYTKTLGKRVGMTYTNYYELIASLYNVDLDFIGVNAYPFISVNGINATMEECVGSWYREFNRTNLFIESLGKDYYITETGCIDKAEALTKPAYYDLEGDTQNGAIMKIFWESFFQTLSEYQTIKKVYMWDGGVYSPYSYDKSLSVIKKYLGGE